MNKKFVITYAQNATPIHRPFFEALQVYCRANKATLLVIPGRYKNPTSIFSEAGKADEWWADALHPFILAGRKEIGKHLTVFGDISIQPTADRPLTGFEVFSGQSSAIFGHPKLQLKTIATAYRYYPRIIATTGSVTRPNYTNSKAGKKSEAHHVYGAAVVEQDGDVFHLRQINATRDGAFIDLDMAYSADGCLPAGRPLGIVFGDIHVEQSDAAVLAATFDSDDSIMKRLRPRVAVYHDVLDFNRRNHHTRERFLDRYERVAGCRGDVVEDEVFEAVVFIDEKTPAETEPIVIASNHDEAFDRWLDEADPKKDPVNARFFYEMMAYKLAAFDASGEWTPAFQLVYEAVGKGRARFLARDEPFRIGDSYVNFHGDMGMNGARGSPFAYAKLGGKTVIGHGHSPEILDGCYRVGVTGSLDMRYNHTPSSWLNTNCVIYSNGKRGLLNVINGRWCG